MEETMSRMTWFCKCIEAQHCCLRWDSDDAMLGLHQVSKSAVRHSGMVIILDMQHCRSSRDGVLRVAAAVYVASFLAGFTNAATVQPLVAIERPVFYR